MNSSLYLIFTPLDSDSKPCRMFTIQRGKHLTGVYFTLAVQLVYLDTP